MVIAANVDSDETPDGTHFRALKPCEECVFEVCSELVVREAEKEVVHVEDEVNRFAGGRLVHEEHVRAIDCLEAVSLDEGLESICPSFGRDTEAVERLDELPHHIGRVLIPGLWSLA